MVSGVPYDSDEGRAMCGAITAIMNGTGFRTSAEMAEHVGTFPGHGPQRLYCIHGAAIPLQGDNPAIRTGNRRASCGRQAHADGATGQVQPVMLRTIRCHTWQRKAGRCGFVH